MSDPGDQGQNTHGDPDRHPEADTASGGAPQEPDPSVTEPSETGNDED